MSVQTPLYGHVSPETAYVVPDYPYGYTQRTTIRYWLETNKHGTRFVSQTVNPKTGKWNKPKPSVYYHWGAMHLDEKGHVQWAGIGLHSKAEDVLEFITSHPEQPVPDLRRVALARVTTLNKFIQGEAWFTINGVKQARTIQDNERDLAEMKVWQQVHALLADAGK